VCVSLANWRVLPLIVAGTGADADAATLALTKSYVNAAVNICQWSRDLVFSFSPSSSPHCPALALPLSLLPALSPSYSSPLVPCQAHVCCLRRASPSRSHLQSMHENPKSPNCHRPHFSLDGGLALELAEPFLSWHIVRLARAGREGRYEQRNPVCTLALHLSHDGTMFAVRRACFVLVFEISSSCLFPQARSAPASGSLIPSSPCSSSSSIALPSCLRVAKNVNHQGCPPQARDDRKTSLAADSESSSPLPRPIPRWPRSSGVHPPFTLVALCSSDTAREATNARGLGIAQVDRLGSFLYVYM
jgi:hypothetical protein